MDLAEGEFEELVYKCNFCDVMFLKLESIMKHTRLYCHRRRRLPRSCTVTTATLEDIAAPNEQLALEGSSLGQSHESSATEETEARPETETWPESKSNNVITEFLEDGHASSRNNDSETGDTSQRTSLKRKNSSIWQESETGSTILSPSKQKKL